MGIIQRIFGGKTSTTDGGLPTVEPAALQTAVDGAMKEWKAKDRASYDGFQNFVAGIATERDKRMFNDYTPIAQQPKEAVNRMYRGSWLAGKIVDVPADEMTREWLQHSWDGRDDNEGGAQAIDDAEEDFDVQTLVNQALKWGSLYGGGAIVIVLRNEDFATPLNLGTVKKGSLQRLHVFDRHDLTCDAEVDRDPNSKNFLKPTYYNIVRAEKMPRVHWSRVIRFEGRKIDEDSFAGNGYWHDSVLQRCLDSVKDYDGTRAAIATMVWEANVDILSIPGLGAMLAAKDGTAKLTERFLLAAILKSVNRMFLIDGGKDGKAGETYTKKEIQFSGVVNVLDKFMMDVSGAADIPITRLFGRAPGGLNATGESDTTNFYDMVRAKQRQLRQQLKKIYQVLVPSTLGRMPKNFNFTFNPLWQMSDTDKATVEKTRAERDKLYYDMGVIGEGLVARELKEECTYRTMEDEDVKLAEELAKLPPEPLPLPPGAVPPANPGTPGAAGNQPAPTEPAAAPTKTPEPEA